MEERRTLKRSLVALALATVLLGFFVLLWLMGGAMCANGHYSDTRETACDAITAEVVLVLIIAPPLSVTLLGVLGRSRGWLYGLFGAWATIGLVLGTLAVLIGSGDL